MKNYSNGMKATEFNRTQIEALSHKITIERWFFNHLEKMAKYYGYDDGKSVERFEQDVLRALETESIIDAQKIIKVDHKRLKPGKEKGSCVDIVI